MLEKMQIIQPSRSLLIPSLPRIVLRKRGTLTTLAYLLPFLCCSISFAQVGGGDSDCDDDVDGDDFVNWGQCMNGVSIGYPTSMCALFDADGDGDSDLQDFVPLQESGGYEGDGPTLYLRVFAHQIPCPCVDWVEAVEEAAWILDQCGIDLVNMGESDLGPGLFNLDLISDADHDPEEPPSGDGILDIGVRIEGHPELFCSEVHNLQDFEDPDSDVTVFIPPKLWKAGLDSMGWLGWTFEVGGRHCWDGVLEIIALNPWLIQDTNVTVGNTLAHEVGHILGLCHPDKPPTEGCLVFEPEDWEHDPTNLMWSEAAPNQVVLSCYQCTKMREHPLLSTSP